MVHRKSDFSCKGSQCEGLECNAELPSSNSMVRQTAHGLPIQTKMGGYLDDCYCVKTDATSSFHTVLLTQPPIQIVRCLNRNKIWRFSRRRTCVGNLALN